MSEYQAKLAAFRKERQAQKNTTRSHDTAAAKQDDVFSNAQADHDMLDATDPVHSTPSYPPAGFRVVPVPDDIYETLQENMDNLAKNAYIADLIAKYGYTSIQEALDTALTTVYGNDAADVLEPEPDSTTNPTTEHNSKGKGKEKAGEVEPKSESVLAKSSVYDFSKLASMSHQVDKH